MQPIIKEEENGRLVIIQRGNGYKLERLLYEAIEDAQSQGYKLAKETDTLADCSFRNYQSTNQGRWVGYKEGSDPKDKIKVVKKEESVVEEKKEEVVVEEAPKTTKAKSTGRSSKNKK